MKKLLSIVLIFLITLGCFGYSAFAKTETEPEMTPAQIRDQILAEREKKWQEEREFDEYISQKIDENGGEYWHDEERGSYFIRVDTSNDPNYNLTDEQLKSDTETLLDLVLSSDCISQYLMFLNDAPDESTYDCIAALCNGLRALELREDIGEVLARRYKIEYSKFLKSGKTVPSSYSDLSELDFMLDQKLYSIWLTRGEQAIVNSIGICCYCPKSVTSRFMNFIMNPKLLADKIKVL